MQSKQSGRSWLLLLCLLQLQGSLSAQTLLIGTYTNKGSEGIYVYHFDTVSATASFRSVAPSSNPSFLAVAPGGKQVFAVQENNPGTVTSFRVNTASGVLQLVNTVASAGAHPCYVAAHPSGRWLAVGNYSSGNLSLYRIETDGSLSEALQTINHSGSSINQSRQREPHVHATVFTADGKLLLVPDLGTDQVRRYRFDATAGKLSPANPAFLALPPGAGPRHLELHPLKKIVYVMNELSGTVAVFATVGKTQRLLQEISSHPEGFSGTTGSADIHLSPDGRHLYCSNRGSANNLAIFSVQKNGTLVPAGHTPVQGIQPRNFTIHPSGNFVLVANQGSDAVVIFRRDPVTGKLTDTGSRINVSQPVCLQWLEGNR
ncbi:MAG TPA: lactonase family protein [Lacibacter sp.]|nr:lactonase family protein [Lacibacter sp.]HMO89676.1 lactonase family protein [Lacibacter sp.]HMP86223.1 lactonase family protein [Lacibacter sp.]